MHRQINYYIELHPAQIFSAGNPLGRAARVTCSLAFETALASEGATGPAQLILAVLQLKVYNHFVTPEPIGVGATSVAFVENFVEAMNAYPADQRSVQHDSAGIDSAIQEAEIVQELVDVEPHHGVPLQAHASLDYLYQKPSEADYNHYYCLSNFDAADFAVDGVAVAETAVAGTEGTAAGTVAADQLEGHCLLKKPEVGNSSSQNDPWTADSYGQPIAYRVNSTDCLSKKNLLWIQAAN